MRKNYVDYDEVSLGKIYDAASLKAESARAGILLDCTPPIPLRDANGMTLAAPSSDNPNCWGHQ
jgi:hypothetical protein